MSNKSAATNQIISLPKGGGALHGIGEKFSPDLHTGTGNFTIPITLPPGRNGFQPQINLVYSTGQGNGVFGLGWSLSIPGISHKTSAGIPVYSDDNDVFILSGAENLVSIGDFDGARRYQPRTEGLFARILYRKDSLRVQRGASCDPSRPPQFGLTRDALPKTPGHRICLDRGSGSSRIPKLSPLPTCRS